MVVINYAVAVTNLPNLHSAAGAFLLMSLATSWFLWNKQYGPAGLVAVLMCMMRYEGVILLSLALVALVASGRCRPQWRHTLPLAALLSCGSAFLAAAWWWSAGVGLDARIDEMLSVTDVSFTRVVLYARWAVVLGSGVPLLWILAKQADRLALYYVLIAAMYLAFLLCLDHVRPYHFGPFVFVAAVGGVRALVGVHGRVRQFAFAVAIALAAVSSYQILGVPRSLCGDSGNPECRFMTRSDVAQSSDLR